jgi:F-type H+-transporting ATPase subunit b
MLIDWVTVSAQIVNFLILVFLLKRFLYGPIIRAMDKREEKIAARLQDAEEKRAEAEKEAQEHRRKSKELDDEREDVLEKARQQAAALEKDLTREARKEVDELRSRWRAALQEEKDAFLKELKKRAGMQVLSVASNALADLADANLEQYMADAFIRRLRNLESEERNKISESLGRSGSGITICSAFDLPERSRQEITDTVRDQISADIEVNYTASPDIICGIEMKTDGYIIGWNLEKYLRYLEEETGRALEESLGEKKIG